jgi:PAS domain S-box-containing protein
MSRQTTLEIARYLMLFVLGAVVMLSGLHVKKEHEIRDYIERKSDQALADYRTLYNQYKTFATIIFNVEINRSDVIEIFQEAHRRDDAAKKQIREALYQKLVKTYELLKRNNIKQLHFHLPDNRSFLRFHRPEKYGDDLSEVRATVKYVNETKRPIDGFEEGRIFNGYRFVYPLFAPDNTHIGSVEISFSALALSNQEINEFHIASNLLVLKEVVDEKVFASEKDNYLDTPFKHFYYDRTVVEKLPEYIRNLQNHYPEQTLNRIENDIMNGRTSYSYHADNSLISTFIPVINPITRHVTAMYLNIDKDRYIKNKIDNYNLVALFGLLSLAVIVYFIYKNSVAKRSLKIYTKDLETYKSVLDHSNILSKGDLRGTITYVNEKFEQISGYTKEELIGKPHSIVRHPDAPKDIYVTMWENLKSKKVFQGILKNRRKDGTPYYVDATIVPLLDLQGNIKEYIGLRHDVTAIMNPKRQFLDDIKSRQQPIAILGKIANYSLLTEFYGDEYMHDVEDYIAAHILSIAPSTMDLGRVYQLEEGKFAFLRERNGAEHSYIELQLQQFQENIRNFNFIVNDKKIDIKIVFSFTTEKEHTFENLMLGKMKALRENIDILCADQYAVNQEATAEKNFEMVDLLKRALHGATHAKIVSHFQPIVDTRTQTVDKYESLVRLIDESGRVISPYFFLDIAKKAGYYQALTQVVLQNSFRALEQTDKTITINLSTMDIENTTVREKLFELISKPQYHGRVVFELLEDEVAKDFDVIKNFISVAKKVGGVRIAIDDFGSGYSNFERLLDFQPDILKIDGSLIKNIVDDSFSQNVVEAILLFAQKEQIQTVAEFVSDEAILEKITAMGVDFAQGFHVGKPAEL